MTNWLFRKSGPKTGPAGTHSPLLHHCTCVPETHVRSLWVTSQKQGIPGHPREVLPLEASQRLLPGSVLEQPGPRVLAGDAPVCTARGSGDLASSSRASCSGAARRRLTCAVTATNGPGALGLTRRRTARSERCGLHLSVSWSLTQRARLL